MTPQTEEKNMDPILKTCDVTAQLSSPGAVAIIASRGRMGEMLMRVGTEKGLGLKGFNRPFDPNLLCQELPVARIVILCVPAAAFDDTLRIVCPAMAHDAILSDITSVKVNPMRQMETRWTGDIVGTHPLFGPHPDNQTALPVALIKGSHCSRNALGLVSAFFQLMGFSTFSTDAVTHDKAMARIQNMNFITSLAYCAQTADDAALTPYITPSFRRRLAAARKMLTDDG